MHTFIFSIFPVRFCIYIVLLYFLLIYSGAVDLHVKPSLAYKKGVKLAAPHSTVQLKLLKFHFFKGQCFYRFFQAVKQNKKNL